MPYNSNYGLNYFLYWCLLNTDPAKTSVTWPLGLSDLWHLEHSPGVGRSTASASCWWHEMQVPAFLPDLPLKIRVYQLVPLQALWRCCEFYRWVVRRRWPATPLIEFQSCSECIGPAASSGRDPRPGDIPGCSVGRQYSGVSVLPAKNAKAIPLRQLQMNIQLFYLFEVYVFTGRSVQFE